MSNGPIKTNVAAQQARLDSMMAPLKKGVRPMHVWNIDQARLNKRINRRIRKRKHHKQNWIRVHCKTIDYNMMLLNGRKETKRVLKNIPRYKYFTTFLLFEMEVLSPNNHWVVNPSRVDDVLARANFMPREVNLHYVGDYYLITTESLVYLLGMKL